ncbi:carbonyl reductase family member 4-like isoform X1 [Limulus polyphemus]|uniref:3-ketoacyl-[acyl-carrier-protein] reductase beta subunit n=1 Tax=Limulus polyphemus TaxID=6850 RepID=A0ABM1BVE8_LIMPO|nr:carbonyl reductase family member 4-like isoform X1 [Limulus polyphemus]
MTLVAAVFGGSQGIGRAVASRFIRSGFSVAILSRNNSKREEAITELEKENAYSVGIKGSQCDVTDEKIVQESLKLVEETLGPLRVVVNCAGINLDRLLVQTVPEDINSIINVNLIGSIITSKIAARLMLKHKCGNIVNIGSIVGMKGNRGQAVYAASKAGLVGLTKSLAQEIGSRGVRVNLVVPGIIQTGMTENMDIEQVKNQVPLSRIGAPEDVAEGVFFLATSPFITGEVLIIDGGLHLNR